MARKTTGYEPVFTAYDLGSEEMTPRIDPDEPLTIHLKDVLPTANAYTVTRLGADISRDGLRAILDRRSAPTLYEARVIGTRLVLGTGCSLKDAGWPREFPDPPVTIGPLPDGTLIRFEMIEPNGEIAEIDGGEMRRASFDAWVRTNEVSQTVQLEVLHEAVDGFGREIARLRELLDHFDRYASIPGGVEYNGSPFQAKVREALAIGAEPVALCPKCGSASASPPDEVYCVECATEGWELDTERQKQEPEPLILCACRMERLGTSQACSCTKRDRGWFVWACPGCRARQLKRGALRGGCECGLYISADDERGDDPDSLSDRDRRRLPVPCVKVEVVPRDDAAVERVARALCDDEQEIWDELDAREQTNYRGKALKALSAAGQVA